MSHFKQKLGKNDFTVIEDKAVYRGFFSMHVVKLKHKLFGGGWSREISREIFHRGEACAAIVYDPVRDAVGLVEQFRSGAIGAENGPWCLEVVAGVVEAGEGPKAVMVRELEEEAGIVDAELLPITSYYSTPGGCSEKIHLYCALSDLSAAGGNHGLAHEDEDIYFHVYDACEVFDAMLQSRMNNAATLIGLLWLQHHRASLRVHSS